MTKNERMTPEERNYQEWREQFLADPEKRAIYEEEAAKSALWLQLVEARQQAGLTQRQMAERLGVSQAQVARIEKQGYDAYTLNTLRRYVAALGAGFSLQVMIHVPQSPAPSEPSPTVYTDDEGLISLTL
jgi:DNA-binding XRE family transcriptional regulator